jgi:hypothetical protein
MFEQISAVSRLRPNKQQYFAVLQELPRVEGSIGMVLATFPTEAPHGDIECRQALRQAMHMAHEGKKEGVRCRVETVTSDLRRGIHVNPFIHCDGNGPPSRFGNIGRPAAIIPRT